LTDGVNLDLIRDAFELLGEMPHHQPTGDLRADLVGELRSFRRAMNDCRLDRVLAVLAERSTALPELEPIRNRFVNEGERIIRTVLAHHVRGAQLEAGVMMLSGLIVHATLMRGTPPSDGIINRGVDIMLNSIKPK
jgi:hypothetical protein